MGERAFCGQRSQCEMPIPTLGASTHPQCSGLPALPAVLGNWRAIFKRTSCSVAEEEMIKSMRPRIEKD